MGLLTDTKQRQKFIDVISRYESKLSFLFYVAGLVWFLALAYKPFNAGTYFSENALLPGLVDHEFYGAGDASMYFNELKKEMKDSPKTLPKEWIYNKFRAIGLETYYHNYSILYPMDLFGKQIIPGQNVYAILRAPRTASTEAIVLTAPLRQKSDGLPQTSAGIALMIALAKFFRQKTYWAKDVVFVITDQELIGMQAWLDAYHGTQVSEYIIPGDLKTRSGSIQAAINLEIASEKIGYINIKPEGLNGQLPNLDLINLVVRLCRKGDVIPMLHRRGDPYEAESFDGYIHSLTTMMKMMWSQASGAPSGNHGLFHRYHIEALTIEGKKVTKKRNVGFETTGRIIEGIFRSLNNLLERFHQSFFFYFLPATNRYVSIGLYMPPFALIVVSGLIKAVALWLGLDHPVTDKEKKPASTNSTTESEDEKKETDSDDEEEVESKPSRLVSILPIILLGVMMSIVAYSSPNFVSSITHRFKMRTDETLVFGFLALACAICMFPKMIQRKDEHEKIHIDWQLLKCLGLIFHCLVLFSVALMNISLAFFLAIVTVPVAVIVRPSDSRWKKWMFKFLLLITSPFVMMYMSAVITFLVQDQKYNDIFDLVVTSWTNMTQGVFLYIVDNFFFGSWLFTLYTFAVFPSWVIFWGVAHCENKPYYDS